MYFVSYDYVKPTPTKATTLAGAKRAAARRCIFQNVTLRVFVGSNVETAVEIATKPAAPRGTWT